MGSIFNDVLLAGLGTLFINFFFDSLNAWKKKKKERSKGGIYAKVEAYISGDYFSIACRYWRFKYATPIGNWASFTACIGIFFIYTR